MKKEFVFKDFHLVMLAILSLGILFGVIFVFNDFDATENSITEYTITGWSGFGGGGGGCNERNVCNAYGDVVKYCAKTLVADCQYGCTSGSCNPAPEPVVQLCGDGRVSGTEQCDDGNTLDLDGCSSNCMIESPVIHSGGVCEEGGTRTFACCTGSYEEDDGFGDLSSCCRWVCEAASTLDARRNCINSEQYQNCLSDS